MKKPLLLALSAGLVVGGLSATPAAAADPAPTNVKIGWKDDTFEFVRVTWEETGDQPNRVFVRIPGDPVQRVVKLVSWAGSGTSTLHVKWTAGTLVRVDTTPVPRPS